MQFCPRCGARCEDGDRFCPTCGLPVSPAQTPASGLGVASMVLGIIGFLTGWCFVGVVPGILAIVLAVLHFCARPRLSGRGLAVAGLVLGILAVAAAVAVILLLSARSADFYEQYQQITGSSAWPQTQSGYAG